MTTSPDKLPSVFPDELRDRTVLSTLIGGMVELTPAGRDFKGRLPVPLRADPVLLRQRRQGLLPLLRLFGAWRRDQVDDGAMSDSFIDAVAELALAAGLDVPPPISAMRSKGACRVATRWRRRSAAARSKRVRWSRPRQCRSYVMSGDEVRKAAAAMLLRIALEADVQAASLLAAVAVSKDEVRAIPLPTRGPRKPRAA